MLIKFARFKLTFRYRIAVEKRNRHKALIAATFPIVKERGSAGMGTLCDKNFEGDLQPFNIFKPVNNIYEF